MVVSAPTAAGVARTRSNDQKEGAHFMLQLNRKGSARCSGNSPNPTLTETADFPSRWRLAPAQGLTLRCHQCPARNRCVDFSRSARRLTTSASARIVRKRTRDDAIAVVVCVRCAFPAPSGRDSLCRVRVGVLHRRGTESWPEGTGLCERSVAHVEPGRPMLKSS